MAVNDLSGCGLEARGELANLSQGEDSEITGYPVLAEPDEGGHAPITQMRTCHSSQSSTGVIGLEYVPDHLVIRH